MSENTDTETGLSQEEKAISLEVLEKMHKGIVAIIEDESIKEYKRLEQFRGLLDRSPKKELLKNHPYVKGSRYLPISHVEGLMDTLFFRQWGTRNFRTMLVGNEMTGIIEVWYIDPISKREITREGVAANQIMVDAIPKEVKEKMTPQERNSYALDLHNNKKPNAMETGYPKLRAQAFKNACLSIGAVFGRDVNRDSVHIPVQIIPQNYEAVKSVIDGSKTGEHK